MGLKTDDAVGSHDGAVRRVGRQLQPVARAHHDLPALGTDDEGDPAFHAVEELRVRMVVASVDRVRAVRPALGAQAVPPERREHVVFG